jgi:hypothetical protein
MKDIKCFDEKYSFKLENYLLNAIARIIKEKIIA